MLSDTLNYEHSNIMKWSLNPYSNGMLSDEEIMMPNGRMTKVLILILMECSLTSCCNSQILGTDRLNPYSNGMLSDAIFGRDIVDFICLNPYSNGMLSDM